MAEKNIYQKLAKCREVVEVLERDKAGYGYNYITLANILTRLQEIFKKEHISLVPRINQESIMVNPYERINVKYDKKSQKQYEESDNGYLVEGFINWVWVNDDNPAETVEVPWFFIGASQNGDPSMSFGSALTYSERYFLKSYFGIADVDEEDVDTAVSRKAEARDAEKQAMLEDTIEKIDTLAKEKAAEGDKAREHVATIVKKYVKDGNYRKLNTLPLAKKLLEDLVAFDPKTIDKEDSKQAKETKGKATKTTGKDDA